uniref:RCC1-like domain-containing protein n=1 Tax=Timema tahoe TaxID=61484 RepID=A0A7R9NZS7_9NEOP|nr:unnamed protein product [Timema tahoe]
MFGWGNTVNGELGLGGIEEEQILSPRELKFSKATQVQQVACGTNHTAVVTNDGQVYTCGNNDFSQLGHNKPRKRLEQVDGLSAYVINNVACGMAHSVAVNEWGQVFSWGSNVYGQLGMGISDTLLVPKVIKTLATCNVIQITCGLNHCLALTNSGVLYSWGCNKHGQLGLGTKATMELKPKPIKSLAGIPIAFIASGGNHTFAVSKSGFVVRVYSFQAVSVYGSRNSSKICVLIESSLPVSWHFLGNPESCLCATTHETQKSSEV